MNNFMTQLRDNWMIILFIGALITSWTMFSSRLSNAEEKIQELEEVYNQIEQMKIDIAVIRERVTNIDKKI